MKITITSTTRIVEVVLANGQTLPARVWEGKTESGIEVQCLITRIAAHGTTRLEELVRELYEHRAPEAEPAFPLRMVL